MATSFQQTDTTAGAFGAQCSGRSNNTDTEGTVATRGGTAGTSSLTLTLDSSANNLNGLWFEITGIDDYDGAAGDWTVRFRLTEGNHQIAVDAIAICHVDSSRTAKNTLYDSGAGLGTNLANATTYTFSSLNQSAGVTIASGDMIIVIIGFDNAQAMTNDIVIVPDQIITAPGSFPLAAPSDPWSAPFTVRSDPDVTVFA